MPTVVRVAHLQPRLSLPSSLHHATCCVPARSSQGLHGVLARDAQHHGVAANDYFTTIVRSLLSFLRVTSAPFMVSANLFYDLANNSLDIVLCSG
jgi:hypothetical protein